MNELRGKESKDIKRSKENKYYNGCEDRCYSNKSRCNSRGKQGYDDCIKYTTDIYRNTVYKCNKISDSFDKRMCLNNADNQFYRERSQCGTLRNNYLSGCNQDFKICMQNCRIYK